MNNTTFNSYWQSFQQGIFPMFEDMLSPSTNEHWRVIATLDTIRIEDDIYICPFNQKGRPKIDRDRFARAFIAKSVLNIPTTVALIDRLKVDKVLRRICGWVFEKKLPCEASFSNAFSEIASAKILEQAHERIIKENLKDDIVFHVSRDSTAIDARESVVKDQNKPEIPITKQHKRGRPATGEIRDPKALSKLELQQDKSLEEMLKVVSTKCDFGCKANSNGKVNTWKGYKLHIDSADNGIPISCFISGASVHDSILSLPLEAETNTRINSLYTLADSAYDSSIIRARAPAGCDKMPLGRNNIKSYGKVEIIDVNPRRKKEYPEMTSSEKNRYKNRTTAERVNASLKDRFGGRTIFVRGAEKVLCHLMFGILALSAEALLNL